MAMIRALYDIGYGQLVPDFKEEPYDLGSFEEIAHYRGGKAGRAKAFEAKFGFSPIAARGTKRRAGTSNQPCQFEATFERGKRRTEPVPVRVRLSQGEVWIEDRLEGQSWQSRSGTSGGTWESSDARHNPFDTDHRFLPPLFLLSSRDESIPDQDRKLIEQLTMTLYNHLPGSRYRSYAYASAPVRSKTA